MTAAPFPEILNAEEFVRLRASGVPAEYEIAAHGSASHEVWNDVIKRFPDMRVWVAHNKTVPLEVLAALARDPDPEIRSAVAMKRKLDAALFDLLSQDADESVRLRLAYNPNAPDYILARLVLDSSPLVRRAADRGKDA